MKTVDISLDFMPAFFHRHLGVNYGEAYYFDPRYRAEVQCAESHFLYEVLGVYGVGSLTPSPSPSLFIQPIDLLKATQGAAVFCPPDATLETRGHVWSGYSVAEIAHLEPQAAAYHPFVDNILAQYRELRQLYGDRADIFGIKTGGMNIHTPYTTAVQLCGESLFLTMCDDVEGTQIIFDKIWAIYQAVFVRLATELGVPPATRVYLGDCSASLLSEQQYREVVLPSNQAISATFLQTSYHSCGSSSHLLGAFADIPGVSAVELGPGTELAQAVRRLPGVAMRPLVDPLLMRNSDAASVRQLVLDLASACAPAPSLTLCAWSLDVETPVENVATMFETVAILR